MPSLDLRDLAEELEGLKEKLSNSGFSHTDQIRLSALKELENQLDSSLIEASDNEPQIIHEDEWLDYCKQLASDCDFIGGKVKNNPLLYHIDWESWADEVMTDYECIVFDGNQYMYRST